jgi:DNA-binding response OmpR family regulator
VTARTPEDSGIFRREDKEEYPASDLQLIQKHFQNLGTLLVVEDHAPVRMMLKHLLGMAAYRVLEAKEGGEALGVLSKNDVDLVLLDIMMPGMEGGETLTEIRKRYDQRELPVIMATARGEVDDITHYLEQGAQDYIVKPFKTDHLLQKIDRLLQVNRQALLVTARQSEAGA